MSYIFGFAEYTLVVMTTRVADERVILAPRACGLATDQYARK
jgi:hypothetical protein